MRQMEIMSAFYKVPQDQFKHHRFANDLYAKSSCMCRFALFHDRSRCSGKEAGLISSHIIFIYSNEIRTEDLSYLRSHMPES